MANQSNKRLAISNKNQLRVLHNVSYFIYGATFIFHKVAKNGLFLHLVFALPGIIAEFLLDKWCKPKYGPNKTLLSPGMDMNQPGLMQYVKDIMLLNWFILLLTVVLGLKAWLFLLLIPAYAGYKALQLIKAGKQLFAGDGSSNSNGKRRM